MIPNKLQEMMNICGIPPNEHESFLEIFNERWKNGYRGDGLIASLCDHGYSELREITSGDEIGLLKLLENFAGHGANIHLHDTDYYLNFKEKKDGTTEFVGVKHKLFADGLIEVYHFKTLRDTEEVIYYEDGYYHYEGEAIVRAECETVFGEYINSYRVNEILNHIRRSTYIKREELNNNPWVLNLVNGLFSIKTFEFTTHFPGLLSTIRIPLKYDPTATCPKIEKFLSEIVYPEHVKLIKEMIGYCLYHDYTYQNWFLLHGEGANAKSSLLALIVQFLGAENVSSVGLQDLNQRFASANLYAKSANIVADLSDADLKRTSMLKQLTGGDIITAEQKFKSVFTYFNFAKLIYSCNKVPLTEDKSNAFFRRVIFIPFPYTFVGKNADKNIMGKLTTEEELSGLLNVAIGGLKRVLNGGFSGSLTAEENEELYERASNPVYGFFNDWCEVNVEKYTVKTELYGGYCEYCKQKKVIAFSEKKFIDQMKLITKMETGQRGGVGHSKRVWLGIVLTDNHDKQDNHVFPQLSSTSEKDSSKYILIEKNPADDAYAAYEKASCEICGKVATLKSYILDGEEIGICDNCREELEDKKANPPPNSLSCICGKQFDTVEVLRHHQANCRVFQHEQDMEARE